MTISRDDLHRLANAALSKWGHDKQLRRFGEESSEAATAILKNIDNRAGGSDLDVAEELVGSIITGYQAEIVIIERIGLDAYNRVWREQLEKLAKAVEKS